MPDELKQNLIQPLPVEGQGPESAYQEFLQNVLAYPNGDTPSKLLSFEDD